MDTLESMRYTQNCATKAFDAARGQGESTMPPENAMAWIAGWFPLLSFVVSFLLYYWKRRAWICTVVTFVPTFAAMWFVFTLHFWPWLLLYVFLSWLACWVVHVARTGQLFTRSR